MKHLNDKTFFITRLMTLWFHLDVVIGSRACWEDDPSVGGWLQDYSKPEMKKTIAINMYDVLLNITHDE